MDNTQTKFFCELKKIIGKKLNDILYQPTDDVLGDNIFVLNFGVGTVFSLHVSCFFRVVFKEKILLTSSDQYFDDEFKRLSFEEYEKERTSKYTHINKNISFVKKLLLNALVQSVAISPTADLTINFDNGLQFDIIIDCLFQGYDYYRLISVNKDNDNMHYVVCFDNGTIRFN